MELYFIICICNAVEAVPYFHKFFHKLLLAFFYELLIPNFVIVPKAFCYILSFRFLRTYLICRFRCNDVYLAIPVMRAKIIHAPFSPISRENFFRAENCCRRNRYNPVVVRIYLISCPAIVETNSRDRRSKSPKRESFSLIESENCTASLQIINECKVSSEQNCFGITS